MEVSFSDANLTTRVRAVRNICLVAVLLALPFSADAQQRRGDERRSGDQRSAERRSEQRQSDQRRSDQRQAEPRQSGQRQAEPRPTSGLAPLGLPPAQTQRLPWWEQRRTPAWEQPQTPSWERLHAPMWGQKSSVPTTINQDRYQRPLGRQRRQFSQPPVVYVLPSYRYFDQGTTLSYGVASSTTYMTSQPPTVVTPPPPLPETGVLRLDVEPRQALQVFVDGLYIGTLADLGDEIELRLGARRIELRAPGYRTLIFDTEIVPDRIIVYRGALDRLPEASAAPRAPEAPAPQAPQISQAPASRTMYVIPGCYLGNVSPKEVKLRPGCDISKLQTITPP